MCLVEHKTSLIFWKKWNRVCKRKNGLFLIYLKIKWFQSSIGTLRKCTGLSLKLIFIAFLFCRLLPDNHYGSSLANTANTDQLHAADSYNQPQQLPDSYSHQQQLQQPPAASQSHNMSAMANNSSTCNSGKQQGCKGIRQWPINWCTSPIIIHKTTSSTDYS